MPPRRLFTEPCVDCIALHNEVEDLRDAMNQLSQRLSLLSLQVTIMKHDLFGERGITTLDANGDFPQDR